MVNYYPDKSYQNEKLISQTKVREWFLTYKSDHPGCKFKVKITVFLLIVINYFLMDQEYTGS